MNIILLGGTVSKRLKTQNDLKKVLCNKSYVYHSKDNLKNSAWLNSTKALVICGDFKEPTEHILNEFKTKSNGIIFEATDGTCILSQVKELSLNLADGNKLVSKYYGCFYHNTGVRARSEDVQMTADGNLIHPDEYYFYGESFDFETYFEKLKTHRIGQNIYHFNTISSTMV